MKVNRKTLIGVLFLFGLMVTIAGILSTYKASATPPSTMNFQGRLASSAGSAVVDGFYNVQFRIYSAASGGSALWTETRQADDRIEVENGLFSVQLGQVNPLDADIFEATDLYFEVTMATPATANCSTAGCATWESPMTPRNKLATSAYAFNAAKAQDSNMLDGMDSTDFATASGSANYIQNTSSPQTANFNITGTGTVGTVQTSNLDTASATTLTIGASNATAVTVAKDMTIGAGKTIAMVGGATSLRPSTPSEGTIYFDSETDELLVYVGSSWQPLNGASSGGDGKAATVVVGTSAAGGVSGAVSSLSTDGADFVNTSTTSAQTAINTAIATLPASGGSVYLMEGVYVVDGSLNLPNNMTLVGAGSSTVLKVKNAHNISINVIRNSDTLTGTGVGIQNLRIDGNMANQAAGTQNGISFSGMGGGSGGAAREGARISGVVVQDMNSTGFYLISSSNNTLTDNTAQGNGADGFVLFGGSSNNLSNNTAQGNGADGFSLSSGSSNNTLTDNTAQGNGADGFSLSGSSNNSLSSNTVQGNSANGFSLSGSSNNSLSSNITQSNSTSGFSLISSSNNTLSSNTSQSNSSYGFRLSSSSNNTLSSNTVQDNTNYGIYITSANNNNVNGNMVHANDNTGIMVLAGSKNLISGNTISDNGASSSVYHGIGVSGTGSNDNSIVGNYISDTAGLARAIDIAAGTGAYLADNRFGTGADGVWHVNGPIRDAGTGTIYSNQIDGTGKLLVRSSGGFAVQSTSGSDIMSVNSTTSLLTVSSDALFNNSADSATALVVQGSTANPLFTADTSNNRVLIGTIANGIQFSANGMVLSGTARGVRTVSFHPEFQGATFTGDGTNNDGSLMSDFCSDATRLNINASKCQTENLPSQSNSYYQWIANGTAQQDYDIYIRHTVPSDYDDGSMANLSAKVLIDNELNDPSTDSSVTVMLYEEDNATPCTSLTTNTAMGNFWEKMTTSSPLGSCTIQAGDSVTLRVRLVDRDNGFRLSEGGVKIGEISYQYRTTF